MATDLTDSLESSLRAVQGGARFVAAWELPHEHDLVDVHAMLSRVIRSQRRLRGVAVLPMPEEP